MTGIYEILCTIDGDTLYTTKTEVDHSSIADSIGFSDLRLYTKEDARSLIDYLTDMFFSEDKSKEDTRKNPFTRGD